MVSFKKLLLAATAILGTVSAIPTVSPPTSVDVHSTLLQGRGQVAETPGELTERQRKGRMTLQWSPSGSVLFLLGVPLPLAAELINAISGFSEGAPGQVVLNNFVDWVKDNPLYESAYNLLTGSPIGRVEVGGMWGTGAQKDIFGFGFWSANMPSASDLGNLVDAITEWASQNGGLVQVIMRPNGFFNPGDIGAGPLQRNADTQERSRTDTCPAIDMLQYQGTEVETDIDYKRYLRWAGQCVGGGLN
ncbi:hypothetical protein BX600DRAFT_437184 [Xylariales sp. PMI_506]|nr:hypothetical protein BX600DRAFT_437184 [Xylariales sp. PMI_506]